MNENELQQLKTKYELLNNNYTHLYNEVQRVVRDFDARTEKIGLEQKGLEADKKRLSDRFYDIEKDMDRIKFTLDTLVTDQKKFESEVKVMISDNKETAKEIKNETKKVREKTDDLAHEQVIQQQGTEKHRITTIKEFLVEALKVVAVVVSALFGYDTFIR